ncbi:hypothetical protein DFH06DRAFT_987743 [Mycena polygramma]|nr:hypothetical protein DFH06DRAFT_1019195 [Mycena polygramma]KAJ7662021.1 hypothetical protein DFH06DRAFT_987743 [Mycena polygramma]
MFLANLLSITSQYISGNKPSIKKLLTSPLHYNDENGARVPHPQALMDKVNLFDGLKNWKYIICDSLYMMSAKLNRPYIIFYPIKSDDGRPLPINRNIKDIKGRNSWQGDIVVGKFYDHEQPFASMVDTSIADYPIVNNFFKHYGAH